jgi:crossover junction endodeoxyribonuclease RuvC
VMRILGVDPGTRTVGYGLLDPGPRGAGGLAFRYVECGVIEAPRDADLATRLQVVAGTLEEIIGEFHPDAVAIEKAFTGKNAASALKLGQARGAIMLVATQHGLPVFEYTPARVKSVVVGHGRATKQQIQQRMQLLFRLRRTPLSDAADALAIALCHGQSAALGGTR